jgi:hypothetical protein
MGNDPLVIGIFSIWSLLQIIVVISVSLFLVYVWANWETIKEKWKQ